MTAGMTAEALQRFLDAVPPERGGSVTAVTPLTGGYSRDTAIGEVSWGDGRRQRLVLRGDPPSDRGVFISDRDEEWRMLAALAATGPARILAPLWYDADADDLTDDYAHMPIPPNLYVSDIVYRILDGSRG